MHFAIHWPMPFHFPITELWILHKEHAIRPLLLPGLSSQIRRQTITTKLYRCNKTTPYNFLHYRLHTRKAIIESMSMVPTVWMGLEWSCCIVLHSTKPDRERHRMWGHRGEAGVVLYSLSLCGDLLALRMTALLMDGLFPSLVAQQNVSENMCARDGWWEAARQNYWG